VAAITDVPHRGTYSRIGSAADDPNRNLGDMGNGCFVIIGENRHQDFAGQRHALHRNSRFSGHGRVWFRTVASDKSCRSDNPGSKIAHTEGAGAIRSTRYPRPRSSRIIFRARTFFASALTAGPRSS
jgi:hypothetical protein